MDEPGGESLRPEAAKPQEARLAPARGSPFCLTQFIAFGPGPVSLSMEAWGGASFIPISPESRLSVSCLESQGHTPTIQPLSGLALFGTEGYQLERGTQLEFSAS